MLVLAFSHKIIKCLTFFLSYTGEMNCRILLFCLTLLSALGACFIQNFTGDVLSGTAFSLFTKLSVPTGKKRSLRVKG